MLDESDDSECDSARDDAEPGSHVSGSHDSDHETEIKREGDTRTTTDASRERSSASKHDSDLSSLRKIREEDRKKGRAISRQIASRITLA